MSLFPSGHLQPIFLPHSSREVRELTVSMMIREFAGSAIMLFEPIYLYTLGYTVAHICLFYAATYAFYLILIPLGGKFIRAHGYEHGIIYSTPFLVFYYLSLFAVAAYPLAIVAAVVCIGLSKTLFWTGFHADFARFGSAKGAQGGEISMFTSLALVASILGPFVGGLLVAAFGYPTLFLVVSALLIISNIPLLMTPEVFVPRELSYRDAWKRLFRRENRTRLLAFFGYGEELVVQALWPLFMFLAVPAYATLGAIGSAASLSAAVITYGIGKLTDHRGRHRMVGIGSVGNALTWLMRIGLQTHLGVLAAHILSRATRSAFGIPLIALTYEYARGYSVTKTALFLEMSVALAKLIAALIAFVIVTVAPPGWTALFIMSAMFSLLYLFARRGFPHHVSSSD